MSLVSRLSASSPKLACARCDQWIFDNLTKAAASERCEGGDIVFRVDFLCSHCPRCVSRVSGGCCLPQQCIPPLFRKTLPDVVKTTYWTADEFELMRKAVGCGQHGEAPRKVQNSNVFLSTYRLSGVNKGDLTHLARNQLFPYIASLVATDRTVVTKSCCCMPIRRGEGLIDVQPEELEKAEKEPDGS